MRPLIGRSDLEETLGRAIDAGAAHCQVFTEATDLTTASFTGTGESTHETLRITGIGIRVSDGEADGYAATAAVGRQGLLQCLEAACRKAGTAASGSRRGALFEGLAERVSLTLETPPTPKARVEDLLRTEIEHRAWRGYDSPTIIWTGRRQFVEVASTSGRWAIEERHSVGLSVEAAAPGPGPAAWAERSLAWSGAHPPPSAEALHKAGRHVRRAAVDARSASPTPQGEYPVLVANGLGGTFFHETCGHLVEAAGARGGSSPLAGLLGRRVAPPDVTVVDDATLEGKPGSRRVDDDANPTRRVVIIDRGILVSLLHDDVSAARMGTVSTGSSRRQDFRFRAAPRMSNTFLLPSRARPRDLLDALDPGLHVKKLGRGQVNHRTGRFAVEVLEGDWHESNRRRPVRPLWITGAATEALSQISAVSDDFDMGASFCRSRSGDVLVGVGQPAVLFSRLSVSETPAGTGSQLP